MEKKPHKFGNNCGGKRAAAQVFCAPQLSCRMPVGLQQGNAPCCARKRSANTDGACLEYRSFLDLSTEGKGP